MSDRQTGTVKCFNDSKGVGFITDKHGKELYVHVNSIKAAGVKSLKEGQPVSFVVANGPKGDEAIEVEAL
ncbi:cold shock domain-containing protein [Pseudomonas sp. MAFF212428]|uniref:Cold shock domain-containing protein n=1 Tax=Pseudomonas brassicae TaxID=2708063 RepID=A0A6B3NMD6_9PSED|nr:cold shock domain-containing protein [Pseudomonas brassicae]NER59832.1 cold shock domain-containing protein [Pseudomonas brassicae]NER62763.1 cold shock domain-containing protein [Pseudomonas brassicae]